MSILKIDQVTVNGSSKIFNGYIYAVSYKPTFGESPSVMNISLISEDGTYFIDDNDVSAATTMNIQLGNILSIDMYLVKWETKSSTQSGKTLELTFWDTSIDLDRITIGILNRNCGATRLILGHPIEYYFPEYLGTTEVFVGCTQTTSTATNGTVINTNLGVTDPRLLQNEELYYQFSDLGIPIPGGLVGQNSLPPGISFVGNGGSFSNITSPIGNHVGTLRQVYNAWASQLGLRYYWENNAVHFIDATVPIFVDTSSIDETQAIEITESSSIENNTAIMFSIGIQKDGSITTIQAPKVQTIEGDQICTNGNQIVSFSFNLIKPIITISQSNNGQSISVADIASYLTYGSQGLAIADLAKQYPIDLTLQAFLEQNNPGITANFNCITELGIVGISNADGVPLKNPTDSDPCSLDAPDALKKEFNSTVNNLAVLKEKAYAPYAAFYGKAYLGPSMTKSQFNSIQWNGNSPQWFPTSVPIEVALGIIPAPAPVNNVSIQVCTSLESNCDQNGYLILMSGPGYLRKQGTSVDVRNTPSFQILTSSVPLGYRKVGENYADIAILLINGGNITQGQSCGLSSGDSTGVTALYIDPPVQLNGEGTINNSANQSLTVFAPKIDTCIAIGSIDRQFVTKVDYIVEKLPDKVIQAIISRNQYLGLVNPSTNNQLQTTSLNAIGESTNQIISTLNGPTTVSVGQPYNPYANSAFGYTLPPLEILGGRTAYSINYPSKSKTYKFATLNFPNFTASIGKGLIALDISIDSKGINTIVTFGNSLPKLKQADYNAILAAHRTFTQFSTSMSTLTPSNSIGTV